MKFLFLFMFIVSATAHAETTQVQTSVPPPADGKIGIRVVPVLGLAESNLRYPGGTLDHNNGMTLGSYIEYGSGAWSVQTGITYNSYGAQSNSGGFTTNIGLDYLTFPIFAKCNILGRADNTPFIKAGLSPSFLASNQVTINGAPNFDNPRLAGMHSFDAPLSFGVGASLFSDGRDALIVEASYFRSTSSVNSNIDLRNEGFLLNLGVSIAL